MATEPKAKPNPKPCRCGCGEITKGGEFRIGHDARHKSNLINEALSGTNDEAIEELEQRGWTKFLEKRREVVARPQRPQRETRAQQEQTDEEKAREAWDRIAIYKATGRVLERRGQYHRGGKNYVEMQNPDHCIALLEGSPELLRPTVIEEFDFNDREAEALFRNRHRMVEGSVLQDWLRNWQRDLVS